MMIQRPKLGETEEDLLKQQEAFLKASGKQVTSKRQIDKNEEKASASSEVIGDVLEKNVSFCNQRIQSTNSNKGFPTCFLIEPTLTLKKKGKKSLFAMQMEKNKKQTEDEMDVDEVIDDSASASFDVKPEEMSSHKSIHEENLQKLSKMSEEEILEEQKKLLQSLDPKLVNFLKNRHKGKENSAKITEEVPEMEKTEVCNLDDNKIKEKLEKYVDSKWINIDFIEKEKLEWIGDIPDKKSLNPDEPYSARFDFKGELQPFSTDIDVRNSLYHHGDEPDRPGYTIQELYQLSRSNVLQQRILALNTLANIIRKTKLGYYDKCFDGQLLHKLVESDLFFLLRFSIDENYLVPASTNCLHNLLCNESDEFCLDKLLGVMTVDEQPLLFNKMDTNKDEENELKDHVVIGCDMIKGVLRTDLLIRLAYVLSNFSPTRETIIRITNCLIRISRHSIEASQKIFQTNNLIKYIYMNVRSATPIYEGVKLLRVMITQSRELATAIIHNYDFNFLISYIEADEIPNITKKDLYLLKLETIYFWRSLLAHDLFTNEFMSWSPFLIRLLLFYTQKVDVNAENDFDFELFSAKTSMLIICNKKKVIADANVGIMMRLCLEKWLTQLMQHRQYNYAICKAIGSAFRFFTSYFKTFGVNASDLDFIKKINGILHSLFQSEIFKEMSLALLKFSHILAATTATRDPDNLPSLCSVYDGGEEFLRIVQSRSSLPFFISLTKYLKAAYRVSHDSKNVIQVFCNAPEIRHYISKINRHNKNVNNWFVKYETTLLSNVLQLLVILEDSEVLPLSFRMLPQLRVDDKRTKKCLEVICDKNSWNLDVEYLNHLSSLYCEMLLQKSEHRTVANYNTGTVPEEWTYKILGLLRGKEAVEAVRNILRFISLILDKNTTLIERVSHTFRYYYLCSVFLTDSNVFDSDIQNYTEKTFSDVVANGKNVNLNLKVDKNKSFYDLYTELITQYAGVSYGLPIFAQFVLFPLQNRFNVSFRKLLWFEYLHVLRVISLSYPISDFVDLKCFVEPCETDESLLVAYINSVSENVIMKSRNPFVYHIAIGNIHNFLNSKNQDEKLLNFLKRKIENLKNETLKNDILNFSLGS